MSHHLRIFMALPLALSIVLAAACDPSEDAHACAPVAGLSIVGPTGFPADDAIAFREQGPPAGMYIQTIGGDTIRRAEFAKLIAACNDEHDPPALLTLSWYQPNLADPSRVLGLGESVIADEALWQCYVDAFEANNPVKF